MRKLFLALMVSAGCGNVPDFGSPTAHRSGPSCGGGQDGILSLAWTVRGAAPSAASCSGIDHLEVDLTGGSCDVSIAPIPCSLDRWRYDHLPEGATNVSVTAVDGVGNGVAGGSVQIDLTPEAPSQPTALDLE